MVQPQGLLTPGQAGLQLHPQGTVPPPTTTDLNLVQWDCAWEEGLGEEGLGSSMIKANFLPWLQKNNPDKIFLSQIPAACLPS